MSIKKLCKNCASYGDKSCDDKHFVYSGSSNVFIDDGLMYWDCESYSAGINVGPNFGCIHWKPIGGGK